MRSRPVIIQLEHAHHLRQPGRLILQRLGGGRLFHQRRILLGRIVHLGNRLVDLPYALALFMAGRNLTHEVGYLFDGNRARFLACDGKVWFYGKARYS